MTKQIQTLLASLYVMLLFGCLPSTTAVEESNVQVQDLLTPTGILVDEVKTPTAANLPPTNPAPTLTQQVLPDGIDQIDILDSVQPIDLSTTNIEDRRGAYPITEYVFSSVGLLEGVLSQNRLLVRSENRSISVVDLENLTSRRLVESVSHPLTIAPDVERIIIPRRNIEKIFPLWSITYQGEDPQFMGTTTGYFPFYATTADGRVLVIMDGHLTLNSYASGALLSQPLVDLETEIGLMWDRYDLTQDPDSSGWDTPWIDFDISPDGETIAIFDGNFLHFWIATLDGQTIREVPLDPSITHYDSVTQAGPHIKFLGWSPDGKYLAYCEGVWGGLGTSPCQNINLLSMDEEQSVVTLNGSNPGSTGVDLSWSPDSSAAVYSLYLTDNQLNSRIENDLYLFDLQTGQAEPLYNAYYQNSFWDNGNGNIYFNCWQNPAEFITTLCKVSEINTR